MPSRFWRPVGAALVLIVAASALPVQAQVVIRERVEVAPEAVASARAADTPRYRFSLSIQSALTSCGWDCFEGLDGGAAYTVSGTRPDGTSFSVTVPVASVLAEDTRYEQVGGCRYWGTGGPKSRGYITYDDTDSATVDLGEAIGPVAVTTNFGDASWNRSEVWRGSVTAASYRKYHSYPYCYTGTRTRVVASLDSYEVVPSRLQVALDPRRPRYGESSTLTVGVPDDEDPANIPATVDVETDRPDLVRIEGPGGSSTTPTDGVLTGVPFATTSGEGLGLHVGEHIQRQGQGVDVRATPGEDVFLRVGSTWLYLSGVRLTLAASADSVAAGEEASLSGDLGTWSGPLDLDPSRPLRASAFYQGETADGVLVNGRTGETSATAVDLSLDDLRAGRLVFRAGPAADELAAPGGRMASRPASASAAADSVGALPPSVRNQALEAWETDGLREGPWLVPSRAAVATARSAASEPEGREVRIEVEAVGTDVSGTTSLVVLPPGLTLTAAPDSVRAGGEVTFTVEGPDLDPGAEVTFTVPDLALGGFMVEAAAARLADGAGQRAASVTRALSAVGDVRFVATDPAPDSSSVVTVTAEVDGRTATADVTVLPESVAVRLLQQKDERVDRPQDGGYLMVSKVRPDWLLPESDSEFASAYASKTEYPALGHWAASEPTAYFDPHTYRIEATGLPADTDPARVRFLLDIPGSDILTDGEERGDTQNTAAYDAVCEAQPGGSLTCRTARFLRLVSNAEPSRGALGRYDDEIARLQTLRVRLGDRVRLFVAVLDEDERPRVLGSPLTYTVGAEAGIDAVREGHLAWRSFAGERSEPALMTERASEDWAQAAIRFGHSTAPDFTRTSARNVAQLSFKSMRAEAQDAGTFSIDLTTPSGSCTVAHTFATGDRLSAVVDALEASATSACGSLGADDVEGYAVDNSRTDETGHKPSRLEDAREFWVVFGRDDAGVAVGTITAVGEARRATSVEIDPGKRARDVTGSEAAYAVAAAFHDGQRQTIDVIVVPHRSINQARRPGESFGVDLGVQAFTSNDRYDWIPPNVVVTRSRLVDERDDYPTGLGHEIGHALLVHAFEGHDPARPGHHVSTLNLMYPELSVPGPDGQPDLFEEGVRAPKRLSRAQHIAARCESGPPGDLTGVTCPATDPADTTYPPLLQAPASGSERRALLTAAPAADSAPARPIDR